MTKLDKDIEKMFLPSLKAATLRKKLSTETINYKVEEKYKNLGLNKTYYIYTYGCQGNMADSEIMAGILESVGYEFTEDPLKADVVLLNTCAVRENAEQRIWGVLGQLKGRKRTHPDMIIGICGCMPQEEKATNKLINSYEFVDIIFGTHNRDHLPYLLYEAYVSDFYKTGSNTYLEIYAGAGEDRRKVVDDHDLPENNFFKGVLENVADGTKFRAEVWTTYYGDNTLIGSVNDYMTKYPEDFAEDNFVSEFIFDIDAFSSSYSEEGYTLFINTDFDNSNNTSEAYKIDLFYNGEQLTNSSSTTEKELEFKLPKYVSYVDAVFTPIKRFDTGEKELTEKKFKYGKDFDLIGDHRNTI